MVATSIGLAVKGVPVVGVVYNPFLDQLVHSYAYSTLSSTDAQQYSGAKGRGSFLNQKIRLPITGKPKPLASLGQALSVSLFSRGN